MRADRNENQRGNPLPAVVVAVCVLGGAVWFWEAVAEDRLIPKRWDRVEGHNIYRSGQLSASLVKRTLARHGIKVIVALTGRDPQDRDQEAEEKAATALGIELRRFPLTGDGTGDIHQYAGAVAAALEAERQGQAVLIHCAAGVQRTGGTIAFLRLLVDKTPPADVVRELTRHGWKHRKNPHLLPYINDNLRPLATMLHERGLIEEIPEPLPILPAP